MALRMVLFLVISTSLLVGFSLYVGWRVIPPGWPLAGRGAAWAALLAITLLIPFTFVSRVVFGWTSDALSWLGYSGMGLLLLLVTFTLLRDLGWLGFKLTGFLPDDPARRQAIFAVTNLVVLGAAGGAFGIGVARAMSRPSVVDVTVPIANLPAALEGFVIAQISDIHVGPTVKRAFIEAIVETVNGTGADLVAITGDLVDGSVQQLSPHTAPLRELKARHGAWFVTGNHEYYSGAPDWIEEMRRIGVRVLVNEHQVLEHDGERVVVAGVTDYTAAQIIPEHASDPHKAMSGAPVDAALKLLLAHQPRSAYEAVKAGFHLQLSGHTHGGQFFPGTLLVRLVQPFVEGLHKLESMWVYTNRGTGYWGPPVRHTSSPSEVTRLVLVRAA